MTDIGNDFITFLKAYYPEDVAKLSADKVDDALINAIIAKHKTKFDIWKKVPERIRDEYLGRVPNDILDAAKVDNNLTLDECREIEKNRELPAPSEIIDGETAGKIIVGAALLETANKKAKEIMQKGYSENAANALAMSSATRQALAQAFKDGKISKEEWEKAHRETRVSDKKQITEDWIKNHPERYLIYIAKEVDRNHMDQMEAIPKMYDLMKRVKELGREKELRRELRKPQSRYRAWKDETKILFDGIRESHSPTVTISRTSDKYTIMQDWIENQPEKMLVHVAKELDRGKISKEDAVKQMNTLMLKVKETGRAENLEALLKEPVSRYEKWSDENRAIFNSMMHDNDIGVAAKQFNKVKENLAAKNAPEQANTPVAAPTPNVITNNEVAIAQVQSTIGGR